MPPYISLARYATGHYTLTLIRHYISRHATHTLYGVYYDTGTLKAEILPRADFTIDADTGAGHMAATLTCQPPPRRPPRYILRC